MSRRAKIEGTAEVPLPIIPMLDMTFQLLAFFIMTYRPSEVSEGAVEFSAPASGSGVVANEPVAELPKEDLENAVQLTLDVQTGRGVNQGGIVNIVVQDPASGSGYACTTVEALGKYLKQKHDEINPKNKTKNDETSVVTITLAAKLKQAEAMQVVDACLHVGQFVKIRFAPPTVD